MKAMLATWMAPVTYPKAQLWQMIEETKIQVCWLLFCPLISSAFISPPPRKRITHLRPKEAPLPKALAMQLSLPNPHLLIHL